MDSEMAMLKSMATMQDHQIKTVDMIESIGKALLEMGRAQVAMETRVRKLEEKIKKLKEGK